MAKKINGPKAGHAWLLALMLAVPFVLVALHAAPSTDDFCYAAQFDNGGFLASLRHYYENVNGRFFATFQILALNAAFPIEHAYFVVPLYFYGLLTLAFAIYFSSIPGGFRSGFPVFPIALVCVLILASNAESISQIFYWLSSGTTHVSASAFTLIALGCLAAVTRDDWSPTQRAATGILGSLAAFVAVGSYEATGPVIIFAGLIALSVNVYLKRLGTGWTILIVSAGVIGLWLNLAAPGTASRAQALAIDADKSAVDLVVIAFRSIIWTTERLAVWITRASVWLVAIVLTFYVRDSLAVADGQNRNHKRALILIVVGLMALPYLAAAPMFYAHDAAQPVRAHFLVDTLCLNVWLIVIPVAFGRLCKIISFRDVPLDCPRLWVGLLLACFLSIAGTGNYFNASMDLLRGFAFAEQARAQIRDVREHPNREHDVIVARRLDRFAPTVKVSDVTPDPRRWENLCFADYLGAYGVRIETIDDIYLKRKKAWYDIVPGDWTDPDPQAIGRPRPVWP